MDEAKSFKLPHRHLPTTPKKSTCYKGHLPGANGRFTTSRHRISPADNTHARLLCRNEHGTLPYGAFARTARLQHVFIMPAGNPCWNAKAEQAGRTTELGRGPSSSNQPSRSEIVGSFATSPVGAGSLTQTRVIAQ